jgi:putative transposase
MPSKNVVRSYSENTHYHIFNRGVEKRKIFESSEDYQRFLYYLKVYFTSPDILSREEPLLKLNLVSRNLFGKIEIMAFCLMPNHFHFLVKQIEKDAVTKLMRQLTTAYSMYFNRKYERVGSLFQGKFKAISVETDDYLLHLSRYIHQNPLARGVSLSDYQWSSYRSYIGNQQIPWLNTRNISEYFNNSNPNFSLDGQSRDNRGTSIASSAYQTFVENSEEDNSKIHNLLLEN